MAKEEVNQTLSSLPVELRTAAEKVPLTYDFRSTHELTLDGLDGTLGLFVGESLLEAGTGGGGLPAQIVLYLENIWFEAEGKESMYREEVRATLLHELGHYLGLEEIDLEERGL